MTHFPTYERSVIKGTAIPRWLGTTMWGLWIIAGTESPLIGLDSPLNRVAATAESSNQLAISSPLDNDSEKEPTHKQIRIFRPTHDDKPVSLNTFCLDSAGHIVAAVGTARLANEYDLPPVGDAEIAQATAPNSTEVKKTAGYIQYYSPDFKLVREIPLDFNPSAVNFDADGNLFVGGDSVLCKFDAAGQLIKRVLSPNLLEKEDLRAIAREKIEADRKSNAEMFLLQTIAMERVINEYRDKKREQEESAKAGSDRGSGQPVSEGSKGKQEESSKKESSGEKTADTPKPTQQLTESEEEQVKELVEMFRSSATDDDSVQQLADMVSVYREQIKSSGIGQEISDEEIDMVISQMGRVNSIGVGDNGVFVTCAATLGYGYDIWKVTQELEDPQMIVEGVSGCCGQMDIQARGSELLIAENTKFRVGIYNDGGKLIGKFGKQDRSGETGFGSCCNPMNIRCLANGEVLTAESSIGTIKKFDASGKLLATIGRAKIGGGCKHVALDYDSSRDRYYMMYQDEDAICVLVHKDSFDGETDDEREAREAREGLGAKVVGSWSKIKQSADETSKTPATSADEKSGVADSDDAVQALAQQDSMATLFGFEAIEFLKDGKLAVKTSNQYSIYGDGASWTPIRQTTRELYISIVNEQVESHKLVAVFEEDHTIKFGVDLGRGVPVVWLGEFQRKSDD